MLPSNRRVDCPAFPLLPPKTAQTKRLYTEHLHGSALNARPQPRFTSPFSAQTTCSSRSDFSRSQQRHAFVCERQPAFRSDSVPLDAPLLSALHFPASHPQTEASSSVNHRKCWIHPTAFKSFAGFDLPCKGSQPFSQWCQAHGAPFEWPLFQKCNKLLSHVN